MANLPPKWVQRVFLETFSVFIIFAVIHTFIIEPHLFPSLQGHNANLSNRQATHVINNSSKAETTGRKSTTVPELVHFIWIYPPDTELLFHQMVCVLSVMRNIKPKGVIFWNTNKPTGKWWTFVRGIVPNMAVWKLEPETSIFNNTVSKPEHLSDIARISILLKYGGIYVDFDVIVLKSFTSFYHHDVTMGAETPDLLGSGIILSKINSTFLKLWKESYKDFNDSVWNYHSVRKPMQIAKKYPSTVHIEWFGFHRPNWYERTWLYTKGKLWNWKENYAVHLWYRTHGVEYDPVNIRCLDTTTGEILRYIYYGIESFVKPC